ncbi:carbonic anhydrase [Lactarius deliciosus]|nr:carbonic anhydrase [Lactarius deliciosus]
MDATLAKILSANAQWADTVKAADPGHPGYFELSAKVSQTPKHHYCFAPRLNIRPSQHRQIHPDDDNTLSVITYAVDHLRSIEHILVVGHTHCGGADVALKVATGKPGPDQPVLQRWLTPLIELARNIGPDDLQYPGPLTRLIEESVRVQVENVAKSEPVCKAWADGRQNLWVHGLVYELETGLLRDLNIKRGPQT